MDRRNALKNISYGLGYIAVTPAVLNLLASCNSEKTLWSAEFLNSTEQYIVTHLSDIIIPATELPGALEVNVPEFLDKMYKYIEPEVAQNRFKKGATIFATRFKEVFAKKSVDGTTAEYEELLASYFNLNKEKEKEILDKQYWDMNDIPEADIDDFFVYNFLLSVRYYTLFGYYTSEKVGEEVLNYDPIPGSYQPCIPLEEIGNAWSL